MKILKRKARSESVVQRQLYRIGGRNKTNTLPLPPHAQSKPASQLPCVLYRPESNKWSVILSDIHELSVLMSNFGVLETKHLRGNALPSYRVFFWYSKSLSLCLLCILFVSLIIDLGFYGSQSHARLCLSCIADLFLFSCRDGRVVPWKGPCMTGK